MNDAFFSATPRLGHQPSEAADLLISGTQDDKPVARYARIVSVQNKGVMMNERHRQSGKFHRRSFVQSAAALASAAVVPQIVPASVLGATAPSNRITVGQIGCGHQAQRIVPSFLVHDDVQIVAVCDVHRAGKGYYYPERVLGRETARRWVGDRDRTAGAAQFCAMKDSTPILPQGRS